MYLSVHLNNKKHFYTKTHVNTLTSRFFLDMWVFHESLLKWKNRKYIHMET